MQTYLLVPLLSCVIAASIAAVILVRNPDQRVNRLVALVLGCTVWWSLCEVVWTVETDPERAAQLVRLSALGWMWFGPLSLHVFAEALGNARCRARRLLPAAYGVSAAALLVYLATPWGLERVVPVSWGWGLDFGPLFPLLYLPTLLCVSYVLAQWRSFVPENAPPRERRLGMWMIAVIAVPMTVASLTDVLLPLLGIQIPRLGAPSVLALGCVVGWNVTRHGYFLLAPDAFAREILESLREGVVLVRPDRCIRFANGAMARLSGLERQELDGLPLADVLPALEGRGAPVDEGLETELCGNGGRRIPVSVGAAHLRDEQQNEVGCVLAIRDLREVSALRSRLVTSGRLAAVGELAAGIAHEINNPITFVRANLVSLRQQWQGLAERARKAEEDLALDRIFAEGEELIEESVEGVDRVAAIVRDVRAFSHAGLGRAELADVNELLENAANVAALRYAVTVERCFGDVPRVRCAPHQLRQVFLNLIFNALQAVGESGRIRLLTQRLDGDGVLVRVEDDGCGIPPDLIERVFDPFFTTRPAGEGTGLGLALCYQIVRNHGGEIRAESEPGRGSVFEIRLPGAGG